MKKRTFIFDGSEGDAEAMLKVLNHYADIAYPRGGSGCAAASRQALMDIADKISQNEVCEISRRQRPLLKAAVNWFYMESEYANTEDIVYLSLLFKLKRS